jgi:hypothetical protein
MTQEQRSTIEDLGRKGMVITKERQRGVVGYGLKKPTEVVAEVAAAIPYKFTMGHFSRAWKALGSGYGPGSSEHRELAPSDS